jgi:hypothetical protein
LSVNKRKHIEMKKILAVMLMVCATSAYARGGHHGGSHVASRKDPFGKTMSNSVQRRLDNIGSMSGSYHAPSKDSSGHYHFANPFTTTGF